MPLAEAQAAFAAEGQMLALDPPLGARAGAATVGGVMAANDSGPLRHRYGAHARPRGRHHRGAVGRHAGPLGRQGDQERRRLRPRRSCSRARMGTLGLIVRVAVRLHPLPHGDRDASSGATDDPDRLGAAAVALAGQPLEADCLDADWRDGAGRLLLRFGGAAAEHQAEAAGRARRGRRARAGRDRGGRRRAVGRPARPPARATRRGRASSRSPAASPTCPRPRARRPRRAAASSAAPASACSGSPCRPRRVAGVRDALAPRACTLLDAPEALRARGLGGARGRRARR